MGCWCWRNIVDVWQGAEALVLHRGWGRHGAAETPLFNNVRTTIVRCGQYGLDGTLVKPLQQVPMNGPLVVPLATLDSELQPVEMIPRCQWLLRYIFRCGIVEPAVHNVRQIHKYIKYLQSASEGVVDLTINQSPHRPWLRSISQQYNIWFAQA